MTFDVQQFIQAYKLFPLYGEDKNLRDFTKEELTDFTQSFIDLEEERFTAISAALENKLPFDTPKQRIATIAKLIEYSRTLDGDHPSAETLSLCYDFSCAVRAFLHEIDGEIDWRYQLKSPRAVSYAKPVLARKTFSGSGFIDARVTANGTANNAVRRGQDIASKILETLTRQIYSQFQIETYFTDLSSTD